MGSEKRARQRENRQALLARRARVERIAKLKRRGIALVAVLVVVAVFAWLTSRESDSAAATSTPTTTPSVESSPIDYAGFREQPTACGATQPPERALLTFDGPVDQGMSGIVSATLDTSCGRIEFSLDHDAAPQSVNSFVLLAREGYFDGTACHRLVPGFVLQCGDPTATGGGNPGYTIDDEFPEEGYDYARGTIAMANAGPGTTGSQFFLVIGDASFLPAQFTVLGTFSDPDGALAKLAEIPLGAVALGAEQSGPLETIYLNSVTIED